LVVRRPSRSSSSTSEDGVAGAMRLRFTGERECPNVEDRA
jgi:hypothetical protein